MTLDINQLGADLDTRLAAADAALAAQFPGNSAGRQPVHTVYVPADRYHAGLAPEWGERALATIDQHADLFAEIVGGTRSNGGDWDRRGRHHGDGSTDADPARTTDAGTTGADPETADLIARVREKMTREPIEDLRIDFEDGYGPRPDDVEDADVARAASALAESEKHGTAPAFRGIRIKSFEAPTRRRGLRTLTAFVTAYLDNGGSLDGFVVTLPKVTSVDQVASMVYACEVIERERAVTGLRFEIQVETPQSILGPDGTALVARMIHASAGRCTALHYGTYDYSAFCGIAAEFQSMAHPVADYAKLVMQAAAAGTGVRLSDGSTNILPVGDEAAVRRGWQLHHDLVRRSLERGFYQGWDLHPAQFPTRYAATFAFYRGGLDRATARLHNYLNRTDSAILDEPATARALADFVLRALQCGAVTGDEVHQTVGLDAGGLVRLASRTPAT